MSKHSKESIADLLANLAKSLGRESLTKAEIERHIAASSLRYHFGSISAALVAAGLTANDSSAQLQQSRPKALADEVLVADFLLVGQQLGHAPSMGEYSANGRYSPRPFTSRWGKWSDVQRVCAAGNPPTIASLPRHDQVQRVPHVRVEQVLNADPAVKQPNTTARVTSARQVYGAPIEFRKLRHAPINEQGVVFLFGMVSAELGFHVEAVQQGFPDCIAKRCVNERRNLWEQARIEFEYRASNFKLHGHDAAQCDVVVCWENDWPECPLEVVELKNSIMRLKRD